MAKPGWKWVPLAEYCFFQEGPGLRKWQWTEAGMKVINVTNILGDGTIDVSNTSRFISLEEFEAKYRHFAIQDRDILLASSGNTYGKLGRIRLTHPVMMNTSVIRLRSKSSDLDDNYLYAFLRSRLFKDQIEAFVIGSAQPNFGPTHLARMRLLLPPIEAQRRIADTVSAYDDLLEVNLRRIELLDEASRRLFEERFVRPLGRTLPLPGARLSEYSLPSGWSFSTLAECAQITMGQAPPSSDYGPENDGLPFHQGVTDFDGHFHVNRYFMRSDARWPRVAQAGDILFSVRAPVGRIALAFEPIALGRGLASVRSRRLGQAYLLGHLKASLPTTDMMGNGTIYKAVTKGDVQSIPILDPGELVATEYEKIASTLWAEILTLHSANGLLSEAREILLPRLVSGRVDLEAAFERTEAAA